MIHYVPNVVTLIPLSVERIKVYFCIVNDIYSFYYRFKCVICTGISFVQFGTKWWNFFDGTRIRIEPLNALKFVFGALVGTEYFSLFIML